MFHILANTVAIGQTVDTDVAPLTDSVFLIQNSHWVPQQDVYLQLAYALSTTILRTRIVTPSLRIPTTPWIRPLGVGSIPPNQPVICDYRNAAMLLKALEETQVWATSGLASGTERFTSILWVSDSLHLNPIPAGNIVTMRGTSTTAATANAWTQLTVTWQDTLPYGMYGIVGLQVQSTNAIAARLIINGQLWRPGALSVTALTNYSAPVMLKGGLGLWGTFRSTALPIVEVLANAADASHECYLEFVRMS